MPVKKETSRVRRGQIVRAALDIIGDLGVQALTTARIARTVGISEANLYRHFKSKDDILMAVVGDIDCTLSDNLKSVKKEDIPALKKMEKIFNLQISYINDNRGIPRAVFSSEILFSKAIRSRLSSFVNRYIKMLAEILEEGTKDGSIRKGINCWSMAGLFIGMVQINTLRWSLQDFKFSLAREAGKLWHSYKKNIEA